MYLYLGKTSLMYAAKESRGRYAAESRNTDTVQMLLEHGADVNTKDNSG